MKINFCLSCNSKLIGRSDKKFCDAQCRSTYHNQNKPVHEMLIQQTNSILRKNRGILAHYCPQGKATVRKEVLEKSGYQFEYFTNIFHISNGIYYFCYEYGFRPIFERSIPKLLIVQRQEYMNKIPTDPWKSI